MEEDNFSFRNLCRTCKNESNDMKYIFENIEMQGLNFRFADMLMACTSIQVSCEDALPNYICLICITKLKDAFTFKRQCELIDSTFRLILKQNEIKQEPESTSDNVNSILDFNAFFDNEDETKAKCDDLNDFLQNETKSVNPILHSQSNNFICNLCFKGYSDESHLNRHMRLHFPNKIFRCKICTKTLTRLEHLKRHMVTHLKQKPHVCKICKRGFNKADNLQSHERRCEGQRPYICPICNRGFMREDSLQVHIGTHDSTAENTIILDSLDDIDKYIEIEEYQESKNESYLEPQVNIDEKSEGIKIEQESLWGNDDDDDDDDDNYLSNLNIRNNEPVKEEKIDKKTTTTIKKENEYCCEKCNKTFSSKVDFEVHKQKHNSPNLFQCTECGRKFVRADHLKRHMVSRHEDTKPYLCNICLKTFNRRDHMLRHVRIHSQEKPFSCEHCEEKFTREELLIKHKAFKHNIGEKVIPDKRFQCHICNKAFTTEKYRDIHIRAHNYKAKIIRCKACEQTFENKDELSKHLKLTNDCSRRFLCSECGQRFTKKDYLLVHIRRHRGEKPFKCKFCGKGFPRTTDLKAHEKCHTGEKNHLCIICGKGFGRAYKLTLHMRTHTGEKPYVCTYCDAAFAQSNDLKAHVRRHTGERYYCDLCDDAFLMGYMLTQHKKNVHGVDLPESQKHLARLNQSAPQPIKPEIRRPIIDPQTGQLISIAVSHSTNLLNLNIPNHHA